MRTFGDQSGASTATVGVLGERLSADAPYRRALLVANPIAGRGKGAKAARELEEGLRRLGIRTDVHMTEARGDGERRVAAMDPEVDLVVAVGGDGTVREVLAGLPRRDIDVGILPNGTANVLAAELGLSRDVHRTLEILASRKARRVDVAEVNGTVGFMVVGIGPDAMAVREVERRRTGPITKWAYVTACFRVFRRYVPRRVVVEVDGERVEGEYGFVLVSNTTSYADLLTLDPGTRLDDGVFEVYLFRAGTRFELLKYLLKGLFGRLPGNLGTLRRARGVRVFSAEGEDPVPYQVDGDYRGETPVDVRVASVPVRFLVP